MINPLQLSGKRILVTGASSGIGRACAQLISQLGGEVVLVARNQNRLEETLQSLTGEGHTIEVFDLEDVETIRGWIKSVVAKREAGLDGLVHCAGVQITQPVQTMKLSQYERLMKLNVTSAFALAQGFRQRGVCEKQASLVLVSSVAAICGKSGLVAYSTSKAALIGMTKSVALELVGQQIRVNALCVGHVDTEMTQSLCSRMTQAQLNEISSAHPLGIGKPMDVANAVAFLLAETSRWITGSTLVVDGGYSVR